MIVKDPIRKKRPVSAFLLFLRDFKKSAMGNNGKKLSYKAATGEAKSVWKEMSEYEKDPYIKEYHRLMKDYVDWKKRPVMTPQLDDTPPQVYATPGQLEVLIAKDGKDVEIQISRRTGSAEFLQQSNEIARDNAKNAHGFAFGKDNKVLPSQADREENATVADSVAFQDQITDDCQLFQEGPSRCSEQALFDQTPGPQFDQTPQFLRFTNESPRPFTSLGPLFDATPVHAARI